MTTNLQQTHTYRFPEIENVSCRQITEENTGRQVLLEREHRLRIHAAHH